MAKSTKKAEVKEKKVKAKKVRTPEQKAARKLRRQQRRANIKAMAPIKEKINAATTTVAAKPSIFPWAERVTSDGLPYSKSVDNPDSILGQLKKLEEMQAKEAADKKKAEELAKKKRLEGQFAGHSGRGILHVRFD